MSKADHSQKPCELLGKRYDYDEQPAPSLEMRARKIGFSYWEIDVLRQLYDEPLKGNVQIPRSKSERETELPEA